MGHKESECLQTENLLSAIQMDGKILKFYSLICCFISQSTAMVMWDIALISWNLPKVEMLFYSKSPTKYNHPNKQLRIICMDGF